MRQIEPWGAIAVLMEAHSKKIGAYHREGTSLLSWSTGKRDKKYPSSIDWKELRPLLPMVCKDLEGRREQGSVGTSRSRAARRNMNQWWKGNQWRTSSMQAETWPVLGMPPMRRAAVRITRSRQPRRISQGDQRRVWCSSLVKSSWDKLMDKCSSSSSSRSKWAGDDAELTQLV